MKFNEVIDEGLAIIKEYKENLATIDRQKVQQYRDILSALCVTLSTYMSDFYDDYIGAEMRRKIFEAKETDRMIDEKLSAQRASIKAKINSEDKYIAEIDAERKFKRAQNMLSSWNQILNTFASRMHEKQT